MTNTPVLFVIFNRPDTTRRVFEAIRRAQPKRLFVAADGPRPNRSGEADLCHQTRAIINVDWDCELKTLYHPQNLGCSRGVYGALSWFFENVEEGIILEDDCLPHPDFFPFCEHLLSKYRHDTRIMQVCGYNHLQSWNPERYDYFYSAFGGIWGWASWRRAWQYYDFRMSLWQNPDAVAAIRNISPTRYSSKKRRELYTKYYNLLRGDDIPQEVSTWDFQWAFCRYINSGMSIVPAKNLIENIGFDTHSLHCRFSYFALPVLQGGFAFPLRDNPIVSADRRFDYLSARHTDLTWRRKAIGFIRSNQKRAMLKEFFQRRWGKKIC